MGSRIEALRATLLSIALSCAACGPAPSDSGSSADAGADGSARAESGPDSSPSLDAGSLPVWPDDWSADITWSDFAADGTKTNTWTGHVSYSWSQRSMRTDLAPPADGGVDNRPVGPNGGTLLLKNATVFLISADACAPLLPFGAPRPDWLSAAGAVPVASTDGGERVMVDLEDGGLSGCFNYQFNRATETPGLFGTPFPCAASSWPHGTYVEYSIFSAQPQPSTVFDLPSQCLVDSGAQTILTSDPTCTRCHQAP